MNLKSKSKIFHNLIMKMDLALAEDNDNQKIAMRLKNLHIKVGDNYVKPLGLDLCGKLAMDELESRGKR
jgi:hypothetical protein